MMIASVMGIFGLLIWLAFLLVPIALLIVLQVWLCKKSLKLGLILPALSLCLSLLPCRAATVGSPGPTGSPSAPTL